MRLRFILALGLASVPASCSLWRGSPEPNLLLVVVDSLRFDAISQSLGAARTPTLHALASDGVSMTGCFSHTPVNEAALAALFSSRMPSRNGIQHDGQPIDPDLPLLADELKDDGYQTFASVSRDFRTQGANGASDPGLLRGFQRVHYPDYEQWPAYEVGTAALEFLRGRDPTRPWFAFVHLSDPHEPYEAYDTADVKATVSLDGNFLESVSISNTAHWSQETDLAPGKHRISFKSDTPLCLREFACTADAGPLPTSFVPEGPNESAKSVVVSIENKTGKSAHCRLTARVHDAPSLAQIRERYRLEVEHVDRAIGALVEALKQSKLYDNTLIVVTATHGEALGERGQIGARDQLFDEVLRVPLVIKPPVSCATELAAMRKKRNMLLRHIDVAPSILALLDSGHLSGAQGCEMLETADRLLIAETSPPEAPARRAAIRDDRYKMVYDAAERRYEMFDLLVDTLEVDNVFMLQGHLRMAWQSRLRQLTFDPSDPTPPTPPTPSEQSGPTSPSVGAAEPPPQH